MVLAHSFKVGHGRARPRERKFLGRGRKLRSSSGGFRGHREGQGACVVSSAQLGLEMGFPARRGLGG